jgi:hypothetical protein
VRQTIRVFCFFFATILGSFLPNICLAGEVIFLRSGFQIEANSHEETDGLVTVELSSGTLQFRTDEIDRIGPSPEQPSAAIASVAPQTALSVEDILRSAGATQASSIEFTELVLSVAKVESGFRQDAVSTKGAQGLMQLMPQTASSLGVDARKADENARGGASYLRTLLDQYHNNAVLALAAYNAGPGAVQKYGGVPPFTETQRYIERVLREYFRLEHQRHSAAK